jgi:phosphatidylinositol-3-phosphatase
MSGRGCQEREQSVTLRRFLAGLAGIAVVVAAVIAVTRQPGAPTAAVKPAGHKVLTAPRVSDTAVANTSTADKLPPIKHVWIIMLENESYGYTFGAAGHKYAPYLTKTLPKDGAMLKNYYGTGHDSLDNYTALASGQAGNYELNEDCGIYAPFVQFGGENFDKWTKFGQLSGEGCVYPKEVKTVGNQLTSKHLSWTEYAQDMGIDPKRDGTVKTANGPACGHPPLNHVDKTDSTAPKNDSYATRHNPWVYFKSVLDIKGYCKKHDLSMKPLAKDLKSVKTTPNFSFITPNTCFDGHDWPKCQNGEPGRLPRVEQFLKEWVPKIEASPAYKQNGMIFITFDESGEDSDASSCCGLTDSLGYSSPAHPNMNENGLYGPGGGRVGGIVLSKYVKPGTVSTHPYNHFGFLKTVDTLFHLKDLGDAKMPQVHYFGSDVFTRPKG